MTLTVFSNHCSDIHLLHTAYKDGEEYIYHYESYATSGVPNAGDVYVTVQLKTEVVLTYLTPTNVQLKVNPVCFYI